MYQSILPSISPTFIPSLLLFLFLPPPSSSLLQPLTLYPSLSLPDPISPSLFLTTFLHIPSLPHPHSFTLPHLSLLHPQQGAWVRVEATFLGVAVYLIIDNCFFPFRTDRALRLGFITCVEETRVVFSEVCEWRVGCVCGVGWCGVCVCVV